MSKQFADQLTAIAPNLNDDQLRALLTNEKLHKVTKTIRAVALNTCKLGNLPIPDHISSKLLEKQETLSKLLSSKVSLKNKQKLLISDIALVRDLLSILTLDSVILLQ